MHSNLASFWTGVLLATTFSNEQSFLSPRRSSEGADLFQNCAVFALRSALFAEECVGAPYFCGFAPAFKTPCSVSRGRLVFQSGISPEFEVLVRRRNAVIETG